MYLDSIVDAQLATLALSNSLENEIPMIYNPTFMSIRTMTALSTNVVSLIKTCCSMIKTFSVRKLAYLSYRGRLS